MTRKVAFSSGHRYWSAELSSEENRRLFGSWASPYNHGHNFVLDVTVGGEVDPVTGMIANIKTLDDVLRERIVAQFNQRSINDEIEAFRTTAPSLENLILYIGDELQAPATLPDACRLVALRLEEMPTFWAEWTAQGDPNTVTLTRTYEFAAAHRLHVPSMSESANVAMFGKCNNPFGHGHNYVLEVTVTGTPSPETGMIVDISALDAAVEEEVVERYDHKHLNEDVPEFADLAPTSEVIAQEIFRRLDGRLPAPLTKVKLWETSRSAFEVTP